MRLGLALTLGLALAAPARAEDPAEILRRQTQELLDAVSAGRPEVWDRLLDDRAKYTSEDGTVLSKKELVAEVRPLPPGVSGTLAVQDFEVTTHGELAVARYVAGEVQQYHGHELRCQYRTTDTWKLAAGGWRLVASQVLALRKDPPAVAMAAADMDALAGRYALSPGITYEIRRTADGLVGQRAGREPEALKAEARDVLFVPGRPRYRKIVQRDASGRVTGFVERREAWDLAWSRAGQ